jgi:hypothetical protein
MILKSFGCSFIFGSELADDGRGELFARPSQQTWPAHLARSLDCEYVCYARPGSGNLRILDTVLNQAVDATSAYYVIGWSWVDRFDYRDDDTRRNPRDNGWKTLMPIDNTGTAKTYYRDLHSEYRDKLTTLINIKLAVDTLNAKRIPFIMTFMDDLIFKTDWNTSPAMVELQEYIRPYMSTFAGKTFYEWSREHGYPITEAWHPLEEAHQAGFEYIKDNLKWHNAS